MSTTAKIEVTNNDLLASLQGFLKSILQQEDIRAILVPQHLPMKNVVMPTLVSDPERLNGVDPLAPYFPMNAAKVVSKLTRRPFGGKVAAVSGIGCSQALHAGASSTLSNGLFFSERILLTN